MNRALNEICRMTGLTEEEALARALRQMHRSVSESHAWKLAEDVLTALAKAPDTRVECERLESLLRDHPNLADFRYKDGADLLFYYVTHAWDEAIEGVRKKSENADTEADRAVLSQLMLAGLRPDQETRGTDVLRGSTFDGSLSLRRPTSVLRFLDDLAAWGLVTEQRAWLVQQVGHLESALDKVVRKGLGFNGEATVALVAGVELGGVTPERWNELRDGANERDLVLVPAADLQRWTGSPVRAVVGIPVQVAYATSGPEEVERLALKEAIAKMGALDFSWADAREAAGLHLLSPGPLASGALVMGALVPEKRVKDGDPFHVGCDMNQERHRIGALGARIAFSSWEDGAMTKLEASLYADLLDDAHRPCLVPSYD